jgi:hypothetical protein
MPVQRAGDISVRRCLRNAHLNKKPLEISRGFANLNHAVQGSCRDRIRSCKSQFWFRDETIQVSALTLLNAE